MKEAYHISPTQPPLSPFGNRRRNGILLITCIGILACGGLYFTFNSLYYAPCDLIETPAIKWDCLIRPTPRPTGFSIPDRDVRQLTYDVASYSDLHWSPDGRYLAAKRCEVGPDGTFLCMGRLNKSIFINLQTKKIHSIEYYNHDAEFILWSSDGTQMFLYIPRSPQSVVGIYTLANGNFQEMTPPLAVLGWDSNELYGIDIDPKSITLDSKEKKTIWRRYSLKIGKIQEEYTFIAPQWSYYILSPDKRMLFLIHHNSSGSCANGEVLSYKVGVDQAPRPFSSNMCNPSWSFDSTKIAHTLSIDGASQIITISDADGRNPRPLFSIPNPLYTSSVAWSPDGTQIAFTYGVRYNAIYVIDVPPHLRPSNSTLPPKSR